jgi:hypothetical protein
VATPPAYLQDAAPTPKRKVVRAKRGWQAARALLASALRAAFTCTSAAGGGSGGVASTARACAEKRAMEGYDTDGGEAGGEEPASPAKRSRSSSPAWE